MTNITERSIEHIKWFALKEFQYHESSIEYNRNKIEEHTYKLDVWRDVLNDLGVIV